MPTIGVFLPIEKLSVNIKGLPRYIFVGGKSLRHVSVIYLPFLVYQKFLLECFLWTRWIQRCQPRIKKIGREAKTFWLNFRLCNPFFQLGTISLKYPFGHVEICFDNPLKTLREKVKIFFARYQNYLRRFFPPTSRHSEKTEVFGFFNSKE